MTDTLKYAGMTIALTLAGAGLITVAPDLANKVMNETLLRNLHKPMS